MMSTVMSTVIIRDADTLSTMITRNLYEMTITDQAIADLKDLYDIDAIELFEHFAETEETPETVQKIAIVVSHVGDSSLSISFKRMPT